MELRKDYILDRWVYMASERKKRPKEFIKHEELKERGICYFCPGNEHLTPPEIGRVGKDKWSVRWFLNKFPVVNDNGAAGLISDKIFFKAYNSYGRHEVIVETPNHKKQLWDLNEKAIKTVLDVYKDRIEKLNKLKNIKYVVVFKNHGKEGGTSLVHPHTQVAALSLIPTLVMDEVNASKKSNGCPYCKIIKAEEKSARFCFKNSSFVAFTPYASRFNFEVWVFPKKHVRNITELGDRETMDLAKILRKILLKLRKLNLAYNFYLHYAPRGKDLHFHLEVTPRIATWAGFELSSGFVINSVMPEDAANFYRS